MISSLFFFVSLLLFSIGVFYAIFIFLICVRQVFAMMYNLYNRIALKILEESWSKWNKKKSRALKKSKTKGNNTYLYYNKNEFELKRQIWMMVERYERKTGKKKKNWNTVVRWPRDRVMLLIFWIYECCCCWVNVD